MKNNFHKPKFHKEIWKIFKKLVCLLFDIIQLVIENPDILDYIIDILEKVLQ